MIVDRIHKNMKSSMAKKILVVEDERAIARVMELKLRQAGLEVIVAVNGAQAIEILDKDQFDCVLLDLILPEKDGFSVLKHIRETDQSLKVIILTNLGQPEDRQRLQEMGIEGYYVKSEMSIYNLVTKIQEIVGI